MNPNSVFRRARDNGRKRDDLRADKIRRGLDQMTGWSFHAADRFLDRNQRAQPMRGIRKIGARYAREKVFRAAAKTGDLVRHCSAENQDDVVYIRGEKFVDGKRNRFAIKSAGYLADLSGAQASDRRQLLGIVPF